MLSVGEILGLRLTTAHNLYFYFQLMKGIRKAIEENTYQSFRDKMHIELSSGTEYLFQ